MTRSRYSITIVLDNYEEGKMIVKENEQMVAMFDVRLHKDILVANSEIHETIEELKRIKRQMEILKNAESILSERVKEFMGDNEELIDTDGAMAVTYKVYEGREMLDAEAVKKQFPDVYKKCLSKAKDFRRFCLK